MILAVTGHRPSKLGGHKAHVYRSLRNLARESLKELEPELVLTGMALGWDMAIADACVELEIPFDAYIPCRDQEKIWPANSQRHYYDLICAAHRVVYVSQAAYSPRLMMLRNCRMVEAASHLLALWNGSKGGTAHCVGYATEKHVPVTNHWDRYAKIATLTPEKK